MPADFDLRSYLDRIEWNGPTRPTLDTLTALVRAHMLHVPFENIDAMLGRRIHSIDLAQDRGCAAAATFRAGDAFRGGARNDWLCAEAPHRTRRAAWTAAALAANA
jgi:hypothetical protein